MIDSRQHVIGKLIPFTAEAITVADTAIGLTASKLASTPKPKKVIITVETSRCRYRMDGTDPSSTVGHVLNPGDSLVLEGYSQVNNTKFIRTGAVSAEIFCTFLR